MSELYCLYNSQMLLHTLRLTLVRVVVQYLVYTGGVLAMKLLFFLVQWVHQLALMIEMLEWLVKVYIMTCILSNAHIFLRTVPCGGNIALLTSNGKKTNDSFGIVAVCVNYVYVPLCDEGWSMANAKVTCKSLGLSPYGLYY